MPSRPGSGDPAGASERRFLIAAGTARYQHFDAADQLPSAPDEVRRIVKLFTRKLGYQRVLTRFGLNPNSKRFHTALSRWLREPERHESDHVVLYYSGHGVRQGRSFYVLTTDSKQDELEGTAFRVGSIA